MAIPDFQTLMLPVLRASADGEVRIGDVVERLAAEFALSEDERAHLLPSGRQTTFANRVHWSKSYLGKAGLIVLSGRGRFTITDRGREVLASPPKRTRPSASLTVGWKLRLLKISCRGFGKERPRSSSASSCNCSWRWVMAARSARWIAP